MKNFFLILGIIIITLGGYLLFSKKSIIPSETQTPETRSTVIPDNTKETVLIELQKLDIQITGSSKELQLQLPSTLSDANWGMKKAICEEGGYTLSIYAGKTLLFTSYPINEIWNNIEPLNVWVASDGDQIACVYKAVSENSMTAPGIFSIKPNPSIRKE